MVRRSGSGAEQKAKRPGLTRCWRCNYFFCYKEPCKKVVLEAARGIIICQQGGNRRWSDSLWLSQGDREFRQGRLIPLPGHLEHKVRTLASLL